VSVEVRIPTVLRKHTNGQKAVQGAGETVREVLTGLDPTYPGLAEAVIAEDGNLARFVNMYVNDEDVRYLGALETEVKDGDVVSILPAVAGGLQ
jgi:sulfur-carrier protein